MELIKNLKEAPIVKSLFIAILGSILLAISAKVKIPFYPVPMTMQTFVVLLLGVSLGWKLGLFTVALYLVEVLLDCLFLLELRKKVWVLFISPDQPWGI